MALFITIKASDLRDIVLKALAITLFLHLAFCSLSDISSCYNGTTVLSFVFLSFLLMFLSFHFFPGFFLGLLSLGLLFGLVCFILALGGCTRFLDSFKSIVLEIETHLYGLFSLGVSLIQISTCLNFDPGLSLIGYSD